MMNGSTNSSKFPFTATQFQELQHQALIYKYMASNIPVPSDLLFSIRRSCSLDHSKMFPSHSIGWSCFQLGGGKKIDPEPGRCRRTDGKKWRCSKEAYPDSKYCERHMHRGKNRSRKPVEIGNQTTNAAVQQQPQQQQLHYNSAGSFSLTNTDYRSSYGLKEVNEQAFFGEPTRDDAWQFTPLTMNSSSSRGVSGLQTDYSYLQLRSINDQQGYGYVNGNMRSEQRDEHQQQTVHRFFDDLPAKNRDSWLDLDNKSQSGSSSVSTTRLSISIPSPSHDFPGFS